MANQAGIELILSAPNVKTTMDEVIEAWEEITEQEKQATKQLDEYHKGINEQLAAMKKMAAENKNIKDSIAEVKKARQEEADAAAFFNEHNQKGIFATIKAYFAQKAELKSLEKQIGQVNKELDKLDLRQRAISLSARRGNTAAIAEYKANEDRIKALNSTLGDLNGKLDSTGAKLELTRGRFSGLSKTFQIVRTAAIAAVAAITLIGVAGLALITAIGRQNDQVSNQFKRSQAAFKRARTELSDALAPIALAFGKLFEGIANKVADFLKDNSDAIFNWARNFAGIMGGLAAAIPIEVNKISFVFKRLAADVELSLALLKLASTAILAPAERRDEALREFEAAKKKVFDINEQIRQQPETTAQAYERGSKRMIAAIDAINLKTRNLTDEQKKAIAAMRKELNSLTADLSKQLEALNVREAGPFAGIILSATLSIRNIEAQGEKAVALSRKLGESQKKINEIEAAVSRLADAVRRDAIKVLTDQSDEIITQINKKLDELRARRAGSSEALRLKTALEAQFKELQTLQEIQRVLIEDARNRGEAVEVISALVSGLERANRIASELANNTTLDFLQDKIVDQFQATKENIEKQLDLLVEQGAKLKKGFDSIAGEDTKRSVSVQIKVNEAEIKVAEERIRQFENAFEIFQKTGVFGVIETEAIIRARIVREDQGIGGIQPGSVEAPEISGIARFGRDIENAVGDVKGALEGILGEDFINRFGDGFALMRDIAVSSIDSQIEAIQNLVEVRQQAVADLEKDVEFELELKTNGLANDFELLKKQLDEERTLRDEAAQKQLDLQAKRDKIQRREDSLNQASALATAIANVFRGTAGNPIATAFAFALSALLLAKFAAAKAQASRLSKAYKGSHRIGESFGELAPGEGENDAPGYDRGLYVVDRKGRTRGVMGGDEFLHKESVSRQHREFFTFVNENEGKFKNTNFMKWLDVMDDLQARGGMSINHRAIVATNNIIREKMIITERAKGGGITEEQMQKAIQKATDKLAKDLIKYYESRPTYVDAGIKEYFEITAKNKNFRKTG